MGSFCSMHYCLALDHSQDCMSPQDLVQELNSVGCEEKKQEFLQKRNKLIIFLQSHENISNTWTPDPLQMHGLDLRLI